MATDPSYHFSCEKLFFLECKYVPLYLFWKILCSIKIRELVKFYNNANHSRRVLLFQQIQKWPIDQMLLLGLLRWSRLFLKIPNYCNLN